MTKQHSSVAQALGHVAAIALFALVSLGLPAALGGVNVFALPSVGSDLISSATTIVESPSGHYTVLINRDLHTNAEVLGHWRDFFEGKDVPLIMEDVHCFVLDGDTSGIGMATSYSSRLPANQMKLRVQDPVLVLSKVQAGVFDMLVASDEYLEAFGGLEGVDLQRTEVVHR